jgi:hypothetical protein
MRPPLLAFALPTPIISADDQAEEPVAEKAKAENAQQE